MWWNDRKEGSHRSPPSEKPDREFYSIVERDREYGYPEPVGESTESGNDPTGAWFFGGSINKTKKKSKRNSKRKKIKKNSKKNFKRNTKRKSKKRTNKK